MGTGEIIKVYEGEKRSVVKLHASCFLLYYFQTTLQDLISCGHLARMVLDFRAASPDSFGTSTLNLKQFQNSIGRHAGEKLQQRTVEDNIRCLQPAGLSPASKAIPDCTKGTCCFLETSLDWCLFGTHKQWQKQNLSYACRKLNVPTHPASLNKSLLLVNTAISPRGH